MKYELRMLDDLKAERQKIDLMIEFLQARTATMRTEKALGHAAQAMRAINGHGAAPDGRGRWKRKPKPIKGTATLSPEPPAIIGKSRRPMFDAVLAALAEHGKPMTLDDLLAPIKASRALKKKPRYPKRVIGVTLANLKKRGLAQKTEHGWIATQ